MKNNFTEHVTISKEQLMAHENNPRKDIGDISELTQSIKKNGIMQNLTVIPAEDNDKFDPKTDKFVILIGHRRFEAGKKAGVKYFPCNIVTGLSEREQLSIMLEENMQRTDLTILEQARGFQMMLDLGETPDSISKKTGFSKSTVRHRLNIAKLDEGIIKDKEDKSFQLTIMDFCELEKIKDVERRNELLKEASDSANLKWIIKREVNNENIRKNKEKVLNILKKMGLTEAPEDIAKNIYRNNIKRIESLYIDADSDTEIPEMELSGDCYYHENGSCITVVRKKTDEELEQEKSAGSQPELSVHAKLANIEKKMKDERTAFIKSILDSDIKEDVRDRLWSMIINGKTCVSYKSIIVFLAGKEFAKIKATDRDEYKAKAESLDTVKQMLCVIEQETGMNITNWYDQYDSDNAKKVIEFTERMNNVVDAYNNRRRDEAFANEVLDDVATQLAALLHELKNERQSGEKLGIDYEEKAFFDILLAVSRKYEFEYPEDKMLALSKEIKIVVDDKAKYTDWSTRDDIKANLQVDLIILLDKYGYPPVTIDDVYKEVLEQAENFKKYSKS